MRNSSELDVLSDNDLLNGNSDAPSSCSNDSHKNLKAKLTKNKDKKSKAKGKVITVINEDDDVVEFKAHLAPKLFSDKKPWTITKSHSFSVKKSAINLLLDYDEAEDCLNIQDQNEKPNASPE